MSNPSALTRSTKHALAAAGTVPRCAHNAGDAPSRDAAALGAAGAGGLAATRRRLCSSPDLRFGQCQPAASADCWYCQPDDTAPRG